MSKRKMAKAVVDDLLEHLVWNVEKAIEGRSSKGGNQFLADYADALAMFIRDYVND